MSTFTSNIRHCGDGADLQSIYIQHLPSIFFCRRIHDVVGDYRNEFDIKPECQYRKLSIQSPKIGSLKRSAFTKR